MMIYYKYWTTKQIGINNPIYIRILPINLSTMIFFSFKTLLYDYIVVAIILLIS